jgi:hypothetical protein
MPCFSALSRQSHGRTLLHDGHALSAVFSFCQALYAGLDLSTALTQRTACPSDPALIKRNPSH